MASLQRAQTGNRVYGGASQAPNRGQVSAKGAQGYLQRELKNRNQGGIVNPVGRDGKSDSRSGVAARALGNSGIGRQQAGGLKTPPNKNKTGGIQGNQQAAPPVGPPMGSVAQPPAPQIRINDKGLLELPYNQNMSASALAAYGDSNDELMALQQEEQQMALEAMQGRRDADTQYGQLKTQSLANNASGGTAFSSMYAKQVSDNASAYTNTLGDISKKEADFNQNAATRRATIQSALAAQLSADAQEYGDELNEDAGDMGYGDYSGESHTHNDSATRVGSGKGKKAPAKSGAKASSKPPAKVPDKTPAKATGGPVKKGKK